MKKNENLKNKKYKEIINRLKRHSIEIIKKVNDILATIYNYKNINDELNMNYIRIRNTFFGYRDGKRIFYDKDGKRYEGDVKNKLREGNGIIYYNNVNKYEGNWKNDIFEGKGIYYFISGNRYKGNFKNDNIEGKGIMYYNDCDRY